MTATLLAPVVVTDCQGCGACLLTCPESALRPDCAPGGTVPATLSVLPDRCTGCGECVEVCPVDAIAFRFERRSGAGTAR